MPPTPTDQAAFAFGNAIGSLLAHSLECLCIMLPVLLAVAVIVLIARRRHQKITR